MPTDEIVSEQESIDTTTAEPLESSSDEMLLSDTNDRPLADNKGDERRLANKQLEDANLLPGLELVGLPDSLLEIKSLSAPAVKDSWWNEKSESSGPIEQAARDIHDAKDKKKWDINIFGAGIDEPDVEKILDVLNPLSHEDRQRVSKAYEDLYGKPMVADLNDKLDPFSAARAEALVKRQDGTSDEAGQIRAELARLSDKNGQFAVDLESGLPLSADRLRAEKDIRDTLAPLSEQELKKVRDTYRADYGSDLFDALQSNQRLSKETRQALEIILKGQDKRTDEDTLRLAEIGLAGKRPDIFNEAFRDASKSARDKFSATGGETRIDESFAADDRQIAKDYLQLGSVGISTLVSGNTKWWHTNKEEIERVVSHATEKERSMYELGEKLAKNGSSASNPDDTKALEFYRKVNDALHTAGGNREVAGWEGQLLRSPQVIEGLISSRDDGWGPLGFGAHTDANKLYGAVESLSEPDFNRLKKNPAELTRVEDALKTFATDEESEKVMHMLREKLASDNFSSSRQTGNRTIEEVFSQNGSGTKENATKLNRLLQMSAEEVAQFRSDPGKITSMLDDSFPPVGIERDLAKRYLENLSSGRPAEALDPVSRVLFDTVTNANPTTTIKDIEAAFKSDPGLRQRLAEPQTTNDTKLAEYFHLAVDTAYSQAQGGGGYVTGMRSSYGQTLRNEFDKQLFETGHLNLDQRLSFAKDKSERFELISAATETERGRLLSSSGDPATKEFQDRIFGNSEEREYLQTVLGQNGKPDLADQFRAYVLGGGKESLEKLEDKLKSLTPAEKQDLANVYFSKYDSLISKDVIGHADENERLVLRDLLSPTDKNVRQIALDTRTERNQHASDWDGFLSKFWDYSSVGMDAATDQLTRFATEHAEQYSKLSPEQKAQLQLAVENYNQAQKNYIESKGEMAEALTDATIAVAAVAGAAFTGGTSLAFLVEIGAAGAMYRAAAIKAIEGSDYKDTPKELLEDLLKGGTASVLGFLGPEQLGIAGVLKGGQLATGPEAQAAIVALRNKILAESAQIVEIGLAGGAANIGAAALVTPLAVWNPDQSFDQNLAAIAAKMAQDAPAQFALGMAGGMVFASAFKVGAAGLEAGWSSIKGLRLNSAGEAEIPAVVGIDEQGRRFVRTSSDGLAVRKADGSIVPITEQTPAYLAEADAVIVQPSKAPEISGYRPPGEILNIHTGDTIMLAERPYQITHMFQDKVILTDSRGGITQLAPAEIATLRPDLVRSTAQQLATPIDDIQRSLINGTQKGDFEPFRSTNGLSGHTMFRGTIATPDGTDVPVIFHVAKSDGDLTRLNNEIRAYKLSQALDLDNGFPPTAIRPIQIEGRDYVGFVQEFRGDPLEVQLPGGDRTGAFREAVNSWLYAGGRDVSKITEAEARFLLNPKQNFDELATAVAKEHDIRSAILQERLDKLRTQAQSERQELSLLAADADPISRRVLEDKLFYSELDIQQLDKTLPEIQAQKDDTLRRLKELSENPRAREAILNDEGRQQLRQGYENALIERIILGDCDMHTMNMVTMLDDSGRITVRNIDMDYAFGRSGDVTLPESQKWGLNTQMLIELSGQPLAPATFQKVQSFVAAYDTPSGRQQLAQMGLTDAQINGVLNRARAFVPADGSVGRFPKTLPEDEYVAALGANRSAD